MAESVSSGVTSFEVDDTFHLIDTETGNTWMHQRDGELSGVSEVPPSRVRPALSVSDGKKAETASPHSAAGTPVSAGTRSSWSLAGNSPAQPILHAEEEEKEKEEEEQQQQQQLNQFSSSTRSNMNEVPFSLISNGKREADSLSPSHVQEVCPLSMKESASTFYRLTASAPEDDITLVSTEQPVQTDHSIKQQESDTEQNVTSPEGTSVKSRMESPVVGVQDDEKNSKIHPSFTNRMLAENAILRSQLEEADHNSARYILLQEKTAEELSNTHKALVFFYKEAENTNCSNEKLCYQNQPDQGIWPGSFLNMLFPGQFVERFLPRCSSQPSEQHFSGMDPSVEENHTSAEWIRNFHFAKWYARHGRGREAMENLLLAITSEDFVAWHTLLVMDEEWNRLTGEERQQWDSLVAAKVTEVLRRGGNGYVQQQQQQQQEKKQSEGKEYSSTPQLASLQPIVLVPFIRRMSLRYAEEKKRYKELVQNIRVTRISPLEEWEEPPASHKFFATVIEDLLLASLGTFPENVELLYLMASFRGLQKRTEESTELLKHVLSIDPSYLLKPFSV
ncbi:uncharacterized protein TM35_000312160 [Trypanosoma theileri]|uniref:Uncharacterized protein n=1 Tax=Trypanosoma theileri TaxID=67003 RepID=A0A1X0NPG9_9TRYP|nr:uncharacterized protein TM35_000312160 [Trypanosoma theileri]ORC86030.1 hypothetical protein TM35_000312160 [Trypanosoma theileri]